MHEYEYEVLYLFVTIYDYQLPYEDGDWWIKKNKH